MMQGRILSFGPYRLDATNARLWCDTQPVRLTAKALQVLHYLAERPGQLVTKDELFSAVWPDIVVSDATLASNVQAVRQALNDDPRSPRYIETVHRQGFRFIAEVVRSQEEENQKAKGKTQKAKIEQTETEIEQKPETEQEPEKEKVPPSTGPRTPDRQAPSSNSPIASSQSLIPTPQPLAPSRSWAIRRFVLMGLLLLVGIIAIVQYLSLPTPNAQSLTPNPQPLSLPDKPSIIILPFTNLSGDPGQEYFSDGITSDITSSLSRIASLFVIARTSAFTYKGKGVKVQDISREMGVRYILEGDVRKTNEQLRITTQLIDGTTGGHLWSERYDRPLKDIFAIQDEIVQKIVTTLKLQLPLMGEGYIIRKHTENVGAYDSFLRGMEYFTRTTKEANAQARQLFENAIALDPQYAEAYTRLGWTYSQDWIWRWSTDPQTLERALALAHQALAIDDSLPRSHSLLSVSYRHKQQHNQAIAAGERAIALDPNNADSYIFQSEVLNSAGRSEEALKMAEQAMRLNPRFPPHYLFMLGWAYYSTGRHAEAVASLKDVLNRNPNYFVASLFLAATYMDQWLFQQNPDAQVLESALAAVQDVLARDDTNPLNHRILGVVYLCQKQYDQAIAEVERAIALDPEEAESYALLAQMLSRLGKTEEAVAMLEQALRRKPLMADGTLLHTGVTYYLTGRLEEAIPPLQQLLARYPNKLGFHLLLAAVYSELGKETESQTEAAEVLRLNPNFSLEIDKQREPIKDQALLERHIAALRKAGLK